MPHFQYVARNPQGAIVNGITEANNSSMVVRILRDQGLIATNIEEGAAVKTRKQRLKAGRIRLDDLVIFSRQFATMIRASLPLIEVLNILAEQSDKVALKNVLREVERDVQGGASLHEAMLKHPRCFNTFFVSMVKAGEAAGMLESILDQVAMYLEKIASIQRKIRSAVMYPTTVAVIAGGIFIFILWFVVPVFVQMFDAVKGTLPLPTQITIIASNLVRTKFLYCLAAAVAFVVALVQWKKTPSGRMAIDRLKLKLPIFGPLFLKVAISKFTRTLGTLINSGVNILAALEIVAATAGNAIIEEAILKTRLSIQNGESISKPLTDCGLFPPMVTRMIDVGERTGRLENMLSKIADFYEDQVNATVAALTSLIEPLLMVALGLVIGFIVISMFMPLFKMLEYIN